MAKPTKKYKVEFNDGDILLTDSPLNEIVLCITQLISEGFYTGATVSTNFEKLIGKLGWVEYETQK